MKSTHMAKIMFEDQKKRKYENKFFYINLHLKDCFEMEFTAC